MSRATPLVLLLATLSAAGCASSSGSAANPALPTTMTPVTQRVVSPTSVVSINTLDVNSGYSQIIVGSMDAAWTALNVTYGELKIPITTLVDAQHLIGNEAFKVRRRIGRLPMQQILDCGNAQGIPNAETYDILMSISSTLAPNPKGGINLLTRIDATGKSPNFSRDAAVTCHSSGALEKEIAEIVRKKVGS
ncbi:MAG: hypothetical protein H3C62_04965 [Gemmatimonadaceae bacterium]|nr:hypothetical protein [Gemmatimonadaceae bacterium]